MEISASLVKELRNRTSCGIMDCKKALAENDGDIDKAAEWLLKKGIAAAAKKAGRIASEGLIHSYIHTGGRIGVLVEINCETDFVAKTPDFVEFVNDICLHIAASNPAYINADQIPQEEIDRQREIFQAQARETGKPDPVVAKIAEGKLSKWVSDVCLVSQPFVKEPSKDVETYRKETVAKLGENIVIRRFTRYELGEGLEKKENNLAAEVASMTCQAR